MGWMSVVVQSSHAGVQTQLGTSPGLLSYGPLKIAKSKQGTSRSRESSRSGQKVNFMLANPIERPDCGTQQKQ